MNILHLTEKDYKTTAWSGGTTTELYIYPADASYAERRFQFRISSAVVALPESDFTALPGVERYITPLFGGFTLTHPGKAPVVMGPLDAPYRFAGREATHCVGCATDFNLMLQGVTGEMTLCSGTAPIRPGFNGFYAAEAGEFALEERVFSMKKGDLLVVFSEEAAQIRLGNRPVLTCWVRLSQQKDRL